MFDQINAGGVCQPTKEFWIPVTYGTNMFSYGYYPVARLAVANDEAYMSFYTPHDFHQIVEAMVVVIAQCTWSDLWLGAYSHYGKHGEAYNTHGDNAWIHEFDVVSGNIYEDTISDILANLEAGDFVGIRVVCQDSNYDSDVLGLRFRYD